MHKDNWVSRARNLSRDTKPTKGNRAFNTILYHETLKTSALSVREFVLYELILTRTFAHVRASNRIEFHFELHIGTEIKRELLRSYCKNS